MIAAEIADMLELYIRMVENLLNVIQKNPDGNEEDWFAAYKKHKNDKDLLPIHKQQPFMQQHKKVH